MERNQYKERLMELQEAVRWTEMIRWIAKFILLISVCLCSLMFELMLTTHSALCNFLKCLLIWESFSLIIFFFSYQQLTNITCSRLFAYIIIWTRVSLFWPWPIEHQKRETWNYSRRKNHPFGNCKFWKEAFRNVKSSIFNSASALIALVLSFLFNHTILLFLIPSFYFLWCQ